MSIPLIDPGDEVYFQMDWTDALPVGVTIGTVTHTAPAPIVIKDESTNAVTGISTVKLSGAVHGRIYQIEGQTTLSNGELMNRQFPLRGFNG